jgi:hypothetical protein
LVHIGIVLQEKPCHVHVIVGGGIVKRRFAFAAKNVNRNDI